MPKPYAKPLTNKPSEYCSYPKGEQYWHHESDAAKNITYSPEGVASKQVCAADTIPVLLSKAAARCGDKIAFRTENLSGPLKRGAIPPPLPLSEWKTWTWKEANDTITLVARAFMKLGLEQHETVAIVAYNSPEWIMCALGAACAGAKFTGIYISDGTEQMLEAITHSGASILCVDSESGFDKLTSVTLGLPSIRAVVCWGFEPSAEVVRPDGSKCPTVLFESLKLIGEETVSSALKVRLERTKPGHCCLIVFTSGTSGSRKAVMLSHDNLVFSAVSALFKSGVARKNQEVRLVSYLPLAHIATIMFDVMVPLILTALLPSWASICFCRNYDLKSGTLVQRLVTVQPTVFFGVPRVYEKIEEKLQSVGARTKGIRKLLITKAKKSCLKYQKNMQIGCSGRKPFLYPIYFSILRRVHKKLGLNKCEFIYAAGAPVSRELLTYFGSLGLNINELYGLSETCGATTFSTARAHRWGTVGNELPGAEVKCLKKNAAGEYVPVAAAKDIFSPSEEEQGEVCVRGRHIMIGYMVHENMNSEQREKVIENNKSTIDENGWLHTGDKGCVDKVGMIRICGRFKDIIITSNGENIAPVPIEDKMKAICPFLSQAILVGEKRKYVTLLVTLKAVGSNGESPGGGSLDSPATKYGETIQAACQNPSLIEDMKIAVHKTASDANCTTVGAARIRKFTVLPIDLSVSGGELTPTLKVKRAHIIDKYSEIINVMYESMDFFVPYSIVGPYADSNESGNVSVPSIATSYFELSTEDGHSSIPDFESQCGENMSTVSTHSGGDGTLEISEK